MKTIKILIADDHPLFLKGLRDTLLEEANFEVIDTASNGQEVLDKVKYLQPDIITLDLDMPVFNGIEVAKILLNQHTDSKIIILSMHKDPDIVAAAMETGIQGYVFKDDAVNDLVSAINTVINNEIFISKNTTKRKFNLSDNESQLSKLTKMENVILKEIANHLTSKEIADKLYISPKTIENHRANIVKKLNIQGANGLLKFALQIYHNNI
jgi:two-component system, NarL family, response regulator DegU